MSKVSPPFVAVGALGGAVLAAGQWLVGEPVDDNVRVIGWMLILIGVLRGLVAPRVR